MVILPAKFSELSKAWSSLAYSTGSLITYSSPGSTQSKNTRKRTNNQSRCNAQATWCKTWHDMRDVIGNAYACFGRKNDEQGISLANQVCRWKDEMISVEIDINITGNGCTVCKWPTKQGWHDSVINSMILLRIQQETILQHPNIAKSIWQWSTRDALKKMNTELRLDHTITGSNKHGKSAKDIRFTDLVKLLDMA